MNSGLLLAQRSILGGALDGAITGAVAGAVLGVAVYVVLMIRKRWARKSPGGLGSPKDLS